MSKGEKTLHSVIAAAKDDGRFKAVEVRKQDNVVEVLWTKSLPAENQTWTAFAAVCGFATGPDGREKAQKRHSPSVVGLDSTGVGFYRVTAPAVEREEMAAIVRMQAESLLPLPSDQIEVAWRTMPSTNGNVDITIAAARREYLQKFAGSVRNFKPRSILLSCEGMAKAWQSFFSERERQALLVSVDAENTQVCLVQGGSVTHAAVLATGMADLHDRGLKGGSIKAEGLGDGSLVSAESHRQAALEAPQREEPRLRPRDDATLHNAQLTERFGQDMRTILGSFGWDESSTWPILVLSDGSDALKSVVEALNAAGMHAKVSVPEARNLKMPTGFLAQDIYQYRVPLGLSLIALEKSSGSLDLFERIVQDEEQEKVTTAWRSVVLAGAVAAVVLVALIVTVYFTDVASAKRWNELVARPDFEAARQRQAMLKTVARHRPDVLQLLVDINAGQNDGVSLDSFQFKKGQVAMVAGQAGNMEQMWKFQANLIALKSKGIEKVEITSQAADPKTKKIKFTIQFQYKSFSRKDSVL